MYKHLHADPCMCPGSPRRPPGCLFTGSGTCKKLTGFSMGRVFTVPKCPYTASVSGQNSAVI